MSQQIINRNVVEIGKPNQNIRGDVTLSQLVVAVNLLGTVQEIRKLTLLQIVILPQVPNPLVHGITPVVEYHTAICFIDNYRKLQ